MTKHIPQALRHPQNHTTVRDASSITGILAWVKARRCRSSRVQKSVCIVRCRLSYRRATVSKYRTPSRLLANLRRSRTRLGCQILFSSSPLSLALSLSLFSPSLLPRNLLLDFFLTFSPFVFSLFFLLFDSSPPFPVMCRAP